MASQEFYPSGTEYYRLFSPLGSPGGSAKGVLQNALAALAALALAVAGFFHLYVDCTPLNITATTALLETQLYNLDEDEQVSWFLMEGSDLTRLPPPEDWDLTLLLERLTEIFLENLEPGREYTIVYTTPKEDGVPEIVHTFTFRTPIGPPNVGPPDNSGSGGSDEPPAPPTPPAPPAPPAPPSEPPDPPEPPKEPENQIPTPPPPGGGGGNDGGSGGEGGGGGTPVNPPPSFVPGGDYGFTEFGPAGPTGGLYYMSFPFLLNGNTFKSFRLNGTILSRSGPGDSGTLQTLDNVEFTGGNEVRFSGSDPYLWYCIPGAYSESALTATMVYTAPDGTEGSVTSPVLTYSPAYLDASASSTNTLTAEIQGSNVVFTAQLNAYHPGTHHGFKISEVLLGSASVDFTSTDDTTVTFTVPIGNVPNGPVTVKISGFPYSSHPEFGDTDFTEMVSSTECSTWVFGEAGPITAPIGMGINGIACTSAVFDGGVSSISSVAVGSTVRLYLNFTGIPSPSEFLLIPNITSSTISNLTVSPVEVNGEAMPAVMEVSFTMPGHNVTNADFSFGAFTAESTASSEPPITPEPGEDAASHPPEPQPEKAEVPPEPPVSEEVEPTGEPLLPEQEGIAPQPPAPEEVSPDPPAT